MATVSRKPHAVAETKIAEQAQRRDHRGGALKERQPRKQETDRDDAEQADGNQRP